MLPREDLDRLFSAAYEELRRLASRVRENDPARTLNPTALVNEAYVKLAASLKPPRAGGTVLEAKVGDSCR